ncbi:MAG: SdpI family protein [Clostridia bacterium]|nr:SdpI family protein [Clostridia bacterium]
MLVFYWIAALIVPLLQLAAGGLLLRRPPKDRNPWYGYRTLRSTVSPEAWARAQQACGRAWVRIGAGALAAAVAVMALLPVSPDFRVMLCMIAGLATILASIPGVERKLRAADANVADPDAWDRNPPDSGKE